jgi:hypothetical protein
MVTAYALNSVHCFHHTLLTVSNWINIGPLLGGGQEGTATYLLKTYFCISVKATQNTANTEIKFYTKYSKIFSPGESSILTLHAYSVE